MKSVPTLPNSDRKTVIGVITRRPNALRKSRKVLISETIDSKRPRFAAILTSGLRKGESIAKNVIDEIPKQWLDSLNEGDIIGIYPDGTINVLWEVESNQNIIFVTNRCNSRCIMCPQPMAEDPVDLHANNLLVLKLIGKESVKAIGLTGGEPTIDLERCVQIIRLCRIRFPEATINFLTNGRLLNVENIQRLITLHHKLMFCIPIHADNAAIHDAITNSPGSFFETITSIQNLALYNQEIELRVVITKLNQQRLKNIADFIYRNFPFSVHVAFMGMEVCGAAHENQKMIWIDPYDYINELCEAVNHLHQRGMNVSIYNIPLCLLPQNYWRFASDSISDWKKGYDERCLECSKKSMCPGLFLTSKIQSQGIRAVI